MIILDILLGWIKPYRYLRGGYWVLSGHKFSTPLTSGWKRNHECNWWEFIDKEENYA